MKNNKKILKAERESLNIKDKLLEALKASTPEVFAEGKVNWDKLRRVLGEHLETAMDKFSFTWAGKAEAVTNVLIPSKATLRTAGKESVKFDTSENLFIEGDNLEVLKLLQKSYFEQVKMIYIDPPYNTGNDFVYKDDFRQPLKNYLEQSGQVDNKGNRLSTNTQASGRFHSDWLSMMYPRLKLAWNLLRHDGVIFISIDDVECANLRKVCDEIFGEENYIATVTRIAKTTSFRGNYFAPSKDYLLCYAKDIVNVKQFMDEVDESQFSKIESEGPRKGERYRDDIAFYLTTLETRPNQRYFIKCPDGQMVIPPGVTFPPEPPKDGDGVWRWYKETFNKKKELLVFKKTRRSPLINKDGKQAHWNIYTKSYLKDKQELGNIPRDIFEGFLNRNGTEELKKLNIPFDFPKPSELIRYLIKISGVKDNDIILDFFAGSGPTAQAVLTQNREDKYNRKFILVQMPELTATGSETYKAGYKTIADVAKERIRRVLKGYDNHKTIDDGFKVFKLGKSNYYDNLFEYDPEKSAEENDKMFKGYLRKSQKELFPAKINKTDIVYENIIKEGLNLNAKIEEVKIGKNKIYKVTDDERELLVCLDEKLTNSAMETLMNKELKEKKFICFDEALNDNDKTNLSLNLTLKTI